jgi:hypothetical protein
VVKKLRVTPAVPHYCGNFLVELQAGQNRGLARKSLSIFFRPRSFSLITTFSRAGAIATGSLLDKKLIVTPS